MTLVFQIAAGYVIGSLALEAGSYIGAWLARRIVRIVVGQLKKAAEQKAAA